MVSHVKGEDEVMLKAEELDPDILLLCSHLVTEWGIDIIKKIKSETKRAKIVIFNSRLPDDMELLLSF